MFSTADDQQPATPAITYESHRMRRGQHTWVDVRDDGTNVVMCPYPTVHPLATLHLTRMAKRAMKKIQWQYRDGLLLPGGARRPSGLIVPGAEPPEDAEPQPWPVIRYIVRSRMHPHRPVVMHDDLLDEILVVMWSELVRDGEEEYMTEAVNDHMSGGAWQRERPTDLWLPQWVIV